MKQAAKSGSAKTLAGSKKTSSDLFFQIAHEVETASREKTFEVIDELIRQRGEAHFKLGGAFAVIIDKIKAPGNEEWLEGHASFKELVEKRFTFSYQKAWNLITIYKTLVAQKIPGSIVGQIGWTKVFVLAKVLTTKNAASLAAKAEGLTVEQLKHLVRGGDPSVKPFTITITDPDQKAAIKAGLRKAKKEANTKYNAVALHNVAQAYLANAIQMEIEGAAAAEKPKIKTKLKEYWLERLQKYNAAISADLGDDGPLLVLDTFQEAWPKIKVSVEAP
jgi:hypothetical protein